MLKLNQKGTSHFIVPVLAVVVIGFIGAKVLSASHADSPTVIKNTSNSAATLTSAAVFTPANAIGGSNGTSSVPYSFTGSQTVTFLSQGQTLSYNNGIKGTSVTSCYSFYVSQPKAGTIAFPVEFTSNNNAVTINVTSTLTDNLQQVCVPPGKLANPGFSVKNLASTNTIPGTIEVLRDTLTW